jgi:hypothetical protein
VQTNACVILGLLDLLGGRAAAHGIFELSYRDAKRRVSSLGMGSPPS